MTVEEGKVTAPLTGPLGHHLEDTKDDDVLLHAIDLVLEPIPGYHQIEDSHGLEVVHP